MSRIFHGQARIGKKTTEYNAWISIKDRCRNKNRKDYKWYGGKGITVCDRWINSFGNFFNDMGPKPTIKHSLERYDGNKGYFPENCKWALQTEQMNNMRRNRIIEHGNFRGTMAQAAKAYAISYFVLRRRLNLGWSVEDALLKPVNYK